MMTRQRSADLRRLVRHDVALLHELARQEEARETAVSMKDRPPGWRQGAARGRIFVGSQIPGVTRMGASGDLESDAGSWGKAMSHCVEPKQDGPGGLLRL